MAKLMFKIPKGFQIPEGVTEGKPFEVYGTVKLLPNGNMSLVEIDGNPISGMADKEGVEDDMYAPQSEPNQTMGQAVMGDQPSA